MYERFTDNARKAMQLANQASQRAKCEYIGSEHILLGLLQLSGDVAVNLLETFNIDVGELRQGLESMADQASTAPNAKQIPRAKKVIEYAMEEARALNHDYVGTEHLLLGLVRVQEGIAAQALRKQGLTIEALRAEVVKMAPGGAPSIARKFGKTVAKLTSLVAQPRVSSESFTDRARKVMQLANQEAQRLNHEYIGTEHILLGLIKEGNGVGAQVVENMGILLGNVRLEVEKLVQSGPDMVTMGKLPQTPRARMVIEYSMEEARNLNHNYVGTEHILLGLMREREGLAAQVLMTLNLTVDKVRAETIHLLRQGIRGTAIASAQTQQPAPRAIAEIPAPLATAISVMDAEIERCNTAKEQAVSIQDFQRAVSLRDEATRLRKERTAMVTEWLAKRSIDAAALAWSDGAVVKLAQTIDENEWWTLLPRLAEWLERGGCADAEILTHCRKPGEHSGRCWVVDLLLSRA
jgi:ATP-dependent Clp protease ATP-binding subunit ClpA